MNSAPAQFYRKDAPDPVADVRAAMSRNDDKGDPDPERLAAVLGVSVFDVEIALEALRVDGEVLA